MEERRKENPAAKKDNILAACRKTRLLNKPVL
jgi:hypothetical protein